MRPLFSQLRLDRVKKFAIHERGLGTGTDLVSVPNLSDIKAISQHIKEWALRERHAASRAPIRKFADLGPKVACSKVDHQPIDAAQLQISSEDRADLLGFLLHDQEFATLQLVAERHHPA